VVSAALLVTDRVGVDRLTIRAVAKVARVPTMSLYSHFSNKAELLDLMVAEVKIRLFSAEELDSWQEEVLATSCRIRAVLTEHPRWVPLLLRRAPEQRVPWWERTLARMQADGLALGRAVTGLTGAVLLAEGLVLLELARASAGHSTDRAELGGLGQFDPSRNFALTMRAYVTGLEKERAPAP
jgi:AcrR family transcriptional regulator